MEETLLNVTVIHPVTRKEILIGVEGGITVEAFILQLIECGVLQKGPAYSMTIKKGEDAAACDPAKKLEDYQVTDGDILELSEVPADDGQAPEQDGVPADEGQAQGKDGAPVDDVQPQKKDDAPAAAEPEKDSFPGTLDAQWADFAAAAGSEEPRITILGIDPRDIPKVNLDDLLRQVEDKPSFNAFVMLLNTYIAALRENEENKRRQKEEHIKLCNERERLKDELKQFEKEYDGKRTGTIMMAVSNVIVGLGTAFITTSPVPAGFTLAAGIITAGLGLWLSLKKSR